MFLFLDVICSNLLLHCLFINVQISACQNLSLWDLLDGSIVIMIKDLCLSVIIHAYHPLTNSCWIHSLTHSESDAIASKFHHFEVFMPFKINWHNSITYEIHAPLSLHTSSAYICTHTLKRSEFVINSSTEKIPVFLLRVFFFWNKVLKNYMIARIWEVLWIGIWELNRSRVLSEK